MEEYFELDVMTLESISKEAGFPIDRDVYLASHAQSMEQGLLVEYRRHNKLIGYTTLSDLVLRDPHIFSPELCRTYRFEASYG